jgi:predicted Zn finger-like uncharacterized protein
VNTVCPSCSKSFVFSDERFGDRASVRVRCPACGGVVTLERPGAASKPPASSGARPPRDPRSPSPAPPRPPAAAAPAVAPDPGAPEASAAPEGAEAGSKGPPTVKIKKSAALEGVAEVDHVPPLPTDRRISLALLSGPDTGKVLPCNTSRAVLGRAGSDIPIQDDEISRRHALLEVRDDRYFLKDLGSTNGTFVDERRITETEIFDRSEFRIGNTNCMLIVTPVDEI